MLRIRPNFPVFLVYVIGLVASIHRCLSDFILLACDPLLSSTPYTYGTDYALTLRR